MSNTELSSKSNNNNEVYITVLTNEDYIRGLKALKRSLKQVKSQHDLVVLVPKSKENQLVGILKKAGIPDKHCKIKVKEDIEVEYPEELHFEQHYWSNTFLNSVQQIVRNTNRLFY